MTATLSPRNHLRALRLENDALRKQVAELEAYRLLAYRDSLTGLWNRRYFDERCAEEMSRAQRNPQKHVFSVLAVDVNGLKAINDVLGHAAGDQSIEWTASFLKRTLRNHDVCCRLGGDEFAVILPDLGPDGCAALIERLRAALSRAKERDELATSLSFGAATWCPGTAIEDLVELADRRMYKDKQRQRPSPRAVERALAMAR